MKALIDKLAVGKIEYLSPKVELSVKKIDETATPDVTARGRFTVSSTNGIPMKGVVYSSNSRIRVLTEQFSGLSSVIEYEIDAHDKNSSEYNEIEGMFTLITNGGEFVVPVSIKIVEPEILSSIGKILTMTDFVNLVQMNYEEALKLFLSSGFTHLLERQNKEYLPLYDGLVKGMDKRLALEEFLIATGQKKAVTISIDQSNKEYETLTDSYQDLITISRDSWGYLDVTVKVYGDFLTACKGHISQEDFAGNKLEYTYLIDKKKLYKGMNYGRIVFESGRQTLTFDIKIANQAQNHEKMKQARAQLMELMELYLSFRMHKCSLKDWASKSLKLADKLLACDRYHNMAMLVKAQIFLSQDKKIDAGWILDDFIKKHLVNANKNLELYCYYLYVKSLQKREAAYTAQVLSEIRQIYEKDCRSYRILWIILYMDPKYDVNKSLKYTMIKGEYNYGCRSPLMYFEALSVLNEQPGLLRILNRFEIALLQFGAKYDWITDKLLEALVCLASSEKKYSDALYHTLTAMYEKKPSEELLTAICSILIRGNKMGKEYFSWYEAGVKAKLRIANLYEYYMLSIDEDYDGTFPEMVYLYFLYNSESIGSRQALLFANIIEHKEELPDIYENYQKAMEQYLIKELFEGKMDRKLSILYSDALKSSLVTGEIAKKLPDIIQTYEITCEDEQMTEVIVIHKEMTEECVSRIHDGKAYVRIYTKNPVILFSDCHGRRYGSTVSYQMKKLSDMQEFLKLSSASNQDNEYLLLHFAEQCSEEMDDSDETVQMFQNILKYPNIRKEYKQNLISELVDIYIDREDDEEVTAYLKQMDQSNLDIETRDKVLDLMIELMMYEEAYGVMKRYGYEGADVRLFARMMTRYVKEHGETYEPLLLEMCWYLFDEGIYSEPILDYLNRYYNGPIGKLLLLWRDSARYGYENHEFEEKILVQIMFTNQYRLNLREVFDSYHGYAVKRKITTAFYVFLSYHILLRKEDPLYVKKQEYIFSYMEQDVLRKCAIPNVCKIALLLYGARKEEMSRKLIPMYKSLLSYMCNYNVLLEDFKCYERWFEIPFYLSDKVIVDYRTHPKSHVYIRYTITDKKGITGLVTEEMHQIFPGLFTKNFVLFYGDTLEYYISEEENGMTKTTDKKQIVQDCPETYKNGGRFDKLNHILVERDAKNLEEEKKLVDEYLTEQKVTEQVFTLI